MIAQKIVRTAAALVVVAIALSLVPPPIRAQEAATPTATSIEKDAAELTARIAELEKSLTGAVLVGHFTVTGRPGGDTHEERYELGDVKHLQGDMWLISARIKYGDHDLTIPLTLPIRWAGDTPIICVDEMAFPGMGTYTARVMFYRDHYAGFWTGKDHGGHLFGTLEHPAEKEAEPAAVGGQPPAAGAPEDEAAK
jgi:hypothetical protein